MSSKGLKSSKSAAVGKQFGGFNFIDESESEEEGHPFTQPYPVASVGPEEEEVLVDLLDRGHEDLQPVLHDWLDFGEMYGSLSEWAPDCLLQICSMDIDDLGQMKVILRDSEAPICAVLNPRYSTQRQFCTEGTLLKLCKSSGDPHHLVIVSIINSCFANFAI